MIFDNLKKNIVDKKTKNYELLKNIAIQEIENENIYERYFKIDKGDIVVDVGAHVGIFTKKCIPIAKKIYAIEPDPLFYKELTENFASEKVIISPSAISYKTGKSTIVSDGNPNSIGEGDIEIDVYSFMDFCQKNDIQKIDFLKLDCEGGEYDILIRENMDWIKNNVKKIAGELHLRTPKNKILVAYTLQLLEDYNMSYMITTVDGVPLSKERLLNNIEYYNEVLFYVLVKEKIEVRPVFDYNFFEGCYLEVKEGGGLYTVEFIDNKTKDIVYKTTLQQGQWGRASVKYYVDWKIVVKDNENNIVFEKTMELQDKRVLISINSASLGDMLAWVPYVEEFRKKHNCIVICSTYNNDLFKKTYPEIKFVEPLTVHNNLYASYTIGWLFKDGDIDMSFHPINPKTQPMQKTASDILGLVYKEIKPKIKKPNVQKEDVVGLAIHSTLQSKYWNNPTGWQDVVDHINEIGYTPLILSKEEDGYKGNKYPKNANHFGSQSIENVIEQLCKCKAFIGIGSGLTWLAWACDVPIILISGFSEPYTEMSGCYRIDAPKNTCRGCFNKHTLDRGNWDWCPEHINTDRQFECSKKIDSTIVIDTLNEILTKHLYQVFLKKDS